MAYEDHRGFLPVLGEAFFQVIENLPAIRRGGQQRASQSHLEAGDALALSYNFDIPAGALTLYTGGQVTNWMIEIINHWSAATGHNLKEFVGAPGQYLQETSFTMPRPLIQQGGNGYHNLVKAK